MRAVTVVALRKESVDRNNFSRLHYNVSVMSLSARRAWIEIDWAKAIFRYLGSLSARRAWIEINVGFPIAAFLLSRSPQGERG